MLGVRIPPALPMKIALESAGERVREPYELVGKGQELLRFDPAVPGRGESGDEEGLVSVPRRGHGHDDRRAGDECRVRGLPLGRGPGHRAALQTGGFVTAASEATKTAGRHWYI